MINRKEWLSNIMEIVSRAIVVGDVRPIYAAPIGTVHAVTKVGYPGDEHDRIVVLHGTFQVPNIVSILMSLAKLSEYGFMVRFESRRKCRGKCSGFKDVILKFQ